MDAERDGRLRRRQRWLRVTLLAGLCVFCAGVVSRRLLEEIGSRTFTATLIAIEVVAASIVITSLVANWRTQRRIRAGRQGERWPLGEPYQVTFQHRGHESRHAGEVHAGTEDVTLLTQVGSPVTLAYAEVTAIRVRRTGIEIETE